MERFLGPMTVKEIRDAYRRMEFGLQDEIAGSNRAWVAFDDLERIKRHYPELVNLVKKEMLSGWGTTSHSSISIQKDMKQKSIPKRTFGLFSKLIILGLIAVVSFLAVYVLKERRWKDLKMLLEDPLLSKAILLYGDEYNVKFEAFMDANRDEINRSLKSRKLLELWLPYVRAVAFSRDGQWSGVNSRVLRGKDNPFTPADCSQDAWSKRWQSAEDKIEDVLAAKLVVQQDWARLLFWDVEWIKQRIFPKNGWVFPGSYYEACILMASKSMKSQSSEEQWDRRVILSRLKWQQNLLLGTDSNQEYQMSGILWSLSCIETSESGDDLGNCIKSIKPSKDWLAYLEHRMNLRQARLLIFENSQLNENRLSVLKSAVQKILERDPMTRFDYDDEKELFAKVIELDGNIAAAVRTINAQKKHVRFRY